MIDTVGFKVIIDRDTYERLTTKTTVTQRIDKQTGDIEFEYNNAKVNFQSSSWNYKVVFKVTDEYWAYDEKRKFPYKASGIPHISFEYSVPKILYGNNMVSVHPCLIYESMHKVKESFEALYGIQLSDPIDWYCFRVDTCANFVLDDEGQVRNYISYLQRLNYPRRVKNMYEDTGLYFASQHNTLKVYYKGAEFKKHDMKRFTDGKKSKRLYEEAQKILRIEVEHRKRIRYLIEQYEKETNVTFKKFQGYVRMKDFIDIFNFKEEMQRVVSKILCGTETKLMETEDVFRLLMQKHSDRQARSFHHIYLLIVTQGQTRAKKVIPKGTYYKALKAFRELGISLMVLDKNKTGCFLDKGVPANFTLDMSEENNYYQLPRTELIPDSDGMEEPF